jgi:hypothetical protein
MSRKIKAAERLETGAWNKLPHHSVHGGAGELYVFLTDKSGKNFQSKWIRGQEAFSLRNRFRNLLAKDKKAFKELVEELIQKHPSRPGSTD